MERYITEIAEFPHDGQRWRLDSFGDIDRNDNVPSDPSVEVLLSPVNEHRSSKVKLTSNLAVDSSRQRSIRVGAGCLPLLRIGSLWRDGVHDESVALNEFKLQSFNNVSIYENDTCRVIPADLRLDSSNPQSYLIPKGAYYLGRRGLRTKFLSIDYGGIAHRILIQVIEAGRFWHFNSARLAQRLLWGQMTEEENKVYHPDESTLNSDGIGRIWLCSGIPKEDRWIVSRYAHNDVALKRGREIHRSLVKAKVKNEPLVPEILPPFEGRTNLTAYGKWFKSVDQWRFLVFWLKTCSHPFPARKLLWDSDHDPRSDGIFDPYRPEAFANVARKTKTAGDKRIKVRSDVEPKKTMLPQMSILNDSRFTDLDEKEDERLPQTECKYRTAGNPSVAEPISHEGYSTGEGTWGETDTKPLLVKVNGAEEEAENSRSRRPACPVSFDKFREALNELERMGGTSIRYIESEDTDAACGAMIFPHNSAWCFVTGRPRQVLVAELCYRKTYFYVFETERRINSNDQFATLLARHSTLEGLDNYTISQILILCAKKRGVWPVKYSDIIGVRLNHTWPKPVEFANRLLSEMNAVRGQSPDNTNKNLSV